MWALVEEGDLSEYLGTLVLPRHLCHLCLQPLRFAAQARNADGCEPLRAVYVGEGRLEEFVLTPEEHALALIRFVCPDIDASSIHVPRDDANWSWTAPEHSPPIMRIYFAPAVQTLHARIGRPINQEGYVSVSRGQLFIGRPIVEAYLRAWLERLRIPAATARFDFGTPSGGIDFLAGAIGGEMLLDNLALAADLVRFAELDKALANVREFIELDFDSGPPEQCGVLADGIYMRLSTNCGDVMLEAPGRPPDRPAA